ncbi:MAG: 16S rRNA (guanine(527)-N(7))-methyltransferase RsmG [Nitrospirota bacterium]
MKAVTPLQILERGAAELGAHLSAAQLGQFERYLVELQKWNRRINLTGTTDLQELISRHVLDSLAGLAVLADVPPGAEVADLGSGAGFPGLPIKMARPDLRMTLIEPRQKRAAFLTTVCALLKLERVTVVETTISLKQMPTDLGHRFDCVLMRAVTEPRMAKALAVPLLASGGRVVIWASREQADRAGAGFVVHRYHLPETNIASALLVARTTT